MSRIFISHSSYNNAAACALRDWLAANGWDDVFLDLDPRRGLIAGQRWQESLKQAAHRCEAVVFLISPAWAASKWCLAEFLLAKSLGKHVFGVIIETVSFDDLPSEMKSEFQIVSLASPGPYDRFSVLLLGGDVPLEIGFSREGLARLHIGLEQAGLDARSFPLDLDRPLYPGLRALDTDDAAIFFGRDADIVRGMDAIRSMRQGTKRILVILGASGAGKSSFLRAGLWPRLRRSDRDFLVLPVLRPGDAPIHGEDGLVECLYRCAGHDHLGLAHNRAHWRNLIERKLLISALDELRAAAELRLLIPDEQQKIQEPMLVLPIDQGEELFNPQTGEEALCMLEQMSEALREGKLLVVISIRSDTYAHLQQCTTLQGLEQQLYSLPPISKGAIKEVIEGPAKRDQEERGANGLRIDPLLTEQLLDEWSGSDALPLLAFTIRRMVDDYGDDHTLDLAEYVASGGLTGALEAAIDKAIRMAVAAGSIPEDRVAQERLVQRAFVPWLVSVDLQTREPLRRMARLDHLPADARGLIGCLLDARLLSSHSRSINGESATFVEVTHEALLRQWPLLSRLIEQERGSLSVLNEVKRDAAAWDVTGGVEDALLHRGERLRSAESLLRREDLQEDLQAIGRAYLAECRNLESKLSDQVWKQQEREKEQIIRTQAAQRRAGIIFVAAFLILAVAGLYIARMTQAANQSASDVLASFAEQAFKQDNYDQAVRFAMAGVRRGDSKFIGGSTLAAENALLRASARSSLRAILPHASNVSSAEFSNVSIAKFSNDSRKIITATGGDGARVWDFLSGKLIGVLHKNNVVKLASFSADNKCIATVSEEETIRSGDNAVLADENFLRLWDAETQKSLVNIKHEEIITSAVFSPSPDGCLIVTASLDGAARLWDSGGKLLLEMRHDKEVNSAAFSSDGKRIVTASSDTTARLWDIEKKKMLAIMLHDDEVENIFVSLTPDGDRIVTISNRTARLWDAEGHPLGKDMSHNGERINTAALSSDGKRIVTASQDRTARLWDATGNLIVTVKHDDSVESAVFSPNGKHIVTASMDKTARLWGATTGVLRATMKHDAGVKSAMFSADGKWIVTASLNNDARVWDAGAGQALALITHDNQVNLAAFSRDGKRIVTISGDKYTRLWDAGTGHALPSSMVHDADVFDAMFGSDGKLMIITASSDGTARLWHETTSRALAPPMKHGERVNSAAFSANGERVVTTSSHGNAFLWDVSTGSILTPPMKHGGEVTSAAFSPDGEQVVTVSRDGTTRLWDAATGHSLYSSMKHKGVHSAAFSPDGKLIVTASKYKTARLWDATTGRPLRAMVHDGNVRAAIFSPDSKRVATISSGAAKIWDVTTGQVLVTMTHDSSINSVAFSPNGKRLVTASMDGTARIWDVTIFSLQGKSLIKGICRGTLFSHVKAKFSSRTQFSTNHFNLLSNQELQLVPMLDSVAEANVCRPAGMMARFKSVLDLR